MSDPSSRILIGLALLLVGPVQAARCDDPKAVKKDESAKTAFGSDRIWEVLITLPAAEYEAMQPIGGFGGGPPKRPEKDAPAREAHRSDFGTDLPWAKGEVTVDGKTFSDVGIRYKGNGTIGDTVQSIKKSFKIDLDRFGGDGAFRGQKSLNLHCDVTDPSRLRETMAYALYRAAAHAALADLLGQAVLAGQHRAAFGIRRRRADVGTLPAERLGQPRIQGGVGGVTGVAFGLVRAGAVVGGHRVAPGSGPMVSHRPAGFRAQIPRTYFWGREMNRPAARSCRAVGDRSEPSNITRRSTPSAAWRSCRPAGWGGRSERRSRPHGEWYTARRSAKAGCTTWQPRNVAGEGVAVVAAVGVVVDHHPRVPVVAIGGSERMSSRASEEQDRERAGPGTNSGRRAG